MDVVLNEDALEEYYYWKENDKKIFNKINRLIQNIKEMPFSGLGKPEPLKENLTGYWSRRINIEHRLVYKISGAKGEQTLTIIQCRFHY